MRPITNGRRFRPVGRYYSIKNGRAAPWESRNELRALYHAEVSPSVVSYIVQPHTLEMVISGVKRTYTPDREEVLDDGRQRIVEVKDEYKTVNDPQYAEKIAHARAVYRLSGKLFCIQERADIEAQPIFNSVELIQSFRRTAITIGDLSRVYEKFAGHTELELADVRDLFSSAALGFAKLSAMMVRRNIAIDLSQKLGPATPVYLVGRR